MNINEVNSLVLQLQNIIQNEPEKNSPLSMCKEFSEIEHHIMLLSKYSEENKKFLLSILDGKLDSSIGANDNHLSPELNKLHSELLRLTHQVQQIELGNYDQNITFLDDFSEAINNTTKQFYNKEKKLTCTIDQLQESFDKLKIILEQTSGIIFEYNIETKTIKHSPNFEKIFGSIPVSQNFPQSAIDAGFIHYDDIPKFTNIFKKICDGSPSEKEELRIRRADGIYIWCLVTMNTIYNRQHKAINAIGQMSDIAFVDKLTGARNRTKFEIDATNLIVGSVPYSLILLNVDKFKVFNDTFGYEIGDKLLKIISNNIADMLLSGEIYARYVADQFFILLKYEDNNSTRGRVLRLYKKIEDEFRIKISCHYNLVICSGICVINDKTKSFNSQSNKSSYALKEIKGSKKSCVAFYNERIRQQILREKEIETKMHSALQGREFHLYLQPKYLLKDETIVGAEALVRWFDPEKGLIFPNDFIPIFENNGFIIEFDMYMLDYACRVIRKWIDNGITPVSISINFSRLHLLNETFVSELEHIIRKYSIPPCYIEIEFTESTMLDNPDVLISVLHQLHSFGFSISMDDFGSGYSSLGMLKDLPIDIIKLDRSFFTDYIDYERGRAVVESVISLAKLLNIQTVAEGVETKVHIDLLREINCDIVQGFYFAKPMPVEDFEKRLLKERCCNTMFICES